MAKAVLLVRVSTASQELEAQRNDLVKYAKSKGYAVDDLFIIEDKESALRRLMHAGAQVVTVEMALFELLKSSKHPNFKEVQALIK